MVQKLLTERAADALETIDELAALVIDDLVADWKESSDPEERERLHAHQIGVTKLREYAHGKASEKDSGEN